VQARVKDFDFWYNRIWSKLQMLQWILVEVGEAIEEIKTEYQKLKMERLSPTAIEKGEM